MSIEINCVVINSPVEARERESELHLLLLLSFPLEALWQCGVRLGDAKVDNLVPPTPAH